MTLAFQTTISGQKDRNRQYPGGRTETEQTLMCRFGVGRTAQSAILDEFLVHACAVHWRLPRLGIDRVSARRYCGLIQRRAETDPRRHAAAPRAAPAFFTSFHFNASLLLLGDRDDCDLGAGAGTATWQGSISLVMAAAGSRPLPARSCAVTGPASIRLRFSPFACREHTEARRRGRRAPGPADIPTVQRRVGRVAPSRGAATRDSATRLK